MKDLQKALQDLEDLKKASMIDTSKEIEFGGQTHKISDRWNKLDRWKEPDPLPQDVQEKIKAYRETLAEYVPPVNNFIVKGSRNVYDYESMKIEASVCAGEILKAKGGKFVLQESHKKVWQDVCAYFCNIESSVLDTKKGIMLLSENKGIGKTFMFQAFKRVASKHSCDFDYRIVSCDDVKNRYISKEGGGSEAIKHYSKGVFMFDDLGTETDGMYMGNKSNVMAEVLQARYNLFNTAKIVTHCTTNLSLKQLGERYGDRVLSRISEMFNVVCFSGEDFRMKDINILKY